MAITPNSVNLTAFLVLVCVAVGAAVLGGPLAAKAVLAGGGLMVGSLLLSSWVLRPGVHVGLASSVVTFKLPVLGLALWKILNVFPTLPVVVGGSSVVIAAVLLSLLTRLGSPLPAEA